MPILLFLFLPFNYAFGQAQAVDFDETEMTQFIESQLKEFNVPGAAVGIVRRDGRVYLRGFGKAADTGYQITPQTPFLIGSNSKSFTALAVMQLVESGKLNLDSSVREYLPWFSVRDQAAASSITVRQLLNHTTGFPASAEFRPSTVRNATISSDRYVSEINRIRPSHKPGEAFEYSDLNYEILGLLIEAISHKPFANYVQESVLMPLDMQSTYLTYDDAVAHGLLKGNQYLFGLSVSISTRPYDADGVASSNIASTAEDLCHYLEALLNGGSYNGHSVISKSSLTIMQQPRSDLGSTYGMGWFIETWRGTRSINHMGMNANFSSMINILPEKGYGIVVLTNVNSFSILGKNNLMDGIIGRINGQQPRSYWPEELMLRLVLLGILIFGAAQLLGRLWTWRKMNFALVLTPNAGTVIVILCGLAMVAVFLILLPILADAPLSELFELQPDIGFGLVVGAAIFLLDAFVNGMIRSKRSREVKPGSTLPEGRTYDPPLSLLERG